MTKNPWDVLEPEDAEKRPEPLYTSVGHALSAWESLEQQFSFLFAYFCTGSGSGDASIPAKRAYGSVITFKGRADLLRAAAEAYFLAAPKHAMKEPFFEILEEVGRFAARRNEIAHGCVTNVFFQYEEGADKTSLEAALSAMRWLHCPPEYATNKHTPVVVKGTTVRQRKYAYSTREIDHYRIQFDRLRSATFRLVLEWAEKYPEADILPPI